MADAKASALTSIPAIDRAADFLYIVDTSAGTSNKVTPNFMLGLSSNPVGRSETQTLTNKTLDSTNLITQFDIGFALQDPGNPTSFAQFDTANITVGQTRTYALPDANTTLVGTGVTQTLTNKTLTSPTINTATIVNPTITADSIAGFSVSNTGTIYGVAVTTGVVTGASSVNGSALVAGTVGSSALATGVPVQMVGTTFSAVATGSTVIPNDDTIPQNTEGDQYMTQVITPKSTTNVLVIQCLAMMSHTAATAFLIGALFQDATANALAASAPLQTTATGICMVPVTHIMTAGTVSATTFKIRLGANGAGTTTFNGQSGGRYFGAIAKSSMIITEYKA